MSENIYAQGLYFNPVRPETPDSVKAWKKGGISINVEKFAAHLEEMKAKADEKGYVRYDLTLNEKDGDKFYSFRLNDWKPPKTDNSDF